MEMMMEMVKREISSLRKKGSNRFYCELAFAPPTTERTCTDAAGGYGKRDLLLRPDERLQCTRSRQLMVIGRNLPVCLHPGGIVVPTCCTSTSHPL